MKKTLMLIPLAAMLLASCDSSSNYNLPKGYKEVDLTNAEQVNEYATKLGDAIKTTYNAFKEEGVELALGLKDASASIYTYSSYHGEVETDHTTEVKDANAVINLKGCGFDKDVRNWKASLGLKASAKVSINDKVYPEDNAEFEISKAALSMSFVDDRLMVDLTDKNLKKSAENVIDSLIKDEMMAEDFKSFVPTICDKWMVNNLLYNLGVVPSEEMVKEMPDYEYLTLPEFDPTEVVTTVSTFMSLLGTQEMEEFKEFFTFAMYEDGRLGLGVKGDIGKILLGDENTLDVSAYVLFDKKGKLEEVKGSVHYALNDHYVDDNGTPDDKSDDIIEENKEDISGNVELEVKYGVKNIKQPSDKDYKGIPISLFLAL